MGDGVVVDSLETEVNDLITSLNTVPRNPEDIVALSALVMSGRLLSNKDLAKRLVTQIKFPHPACDKEFVTKVVGIFEYGEKEDRFPSFVPDFVSRDDVILEEGAGLALCRLIENYMLDNHEDLVLDLVKRLAKERERVHTGEAFKRNEGRYFARKHKELNDRILDALMQRGFAPLLFKEGLLQDHVLNGYTRKFPAVDVDLRKPLEVRDYYEPDIYQAEILRAQLNLNESSEFFIDLIKWENNGLNTQDGIDRFIANLRYAMDGSSEQVNRSGREIIAAILDQGYVIKTPISTDHLAVRMIDPRQI